MQGQAVSVTPASGRALQSERLSMEMARPADAAFVLRIVNQESWIRNIGDRGVRTVEDASRYIEDRMLAPMRTLGYGMYVVRLKADGASVGLCGLVKREALPHPDLGFALLDEHVGRGYAEEAATAVLRHARDTLKLARVLAIVAPTNPRSIRLLEKLGFARQDAPHVTPAGETLRLYAK